MTSATTRKMKNRILAISTAPASDTTEAKDRGDQGNNEKDECVVQHGRSPRLANPPICRRIRLRHRLQAHFSLISRVGSGAEKPKQRRFRCRAKSTAHTAAHRVCRGGRSHTMRIVRGAVRND